MGTTDAPAAITTFAPPGEPPRAVTNDRLKAYWSRHVSELCELEDAWKGSDAEKERHRIYATLLMAMVYEYWNGSKYGRRGTYPLNYLPKDGDAAYLSGDYYGHNIAALAVDAKGNVLDFDFNHNDLFNSSAEHAEARLVRRLYSLSKVNDTWAAVARAAKKAAAGPQAQAVPPKAPLKKPYASLSDVTVYTSLESCAQCSGVMALAGVKQVVYLQTDPGTYWIGRILRNLTSGKLRAPLPISGAEIGSPLFDRLDSAYRTFATDPGRQAFWIPGEGAEPDKSVAVTSFLCTSEAREMFREGGDLEALHLEHPRFIHTPDPKVDGDPHVHTADCGLTNARALEEAKGFLEYVRGNGRRGTPHNL